VLNLALAPALAPLLPRPWVVVVNAALLVATLNWILLPGLHWLTRGWALRGHGTAPAAPSDDRF
jgi:antibiotic biosynthesis monooxygenase (ABM) superfamily enzyme